MLDAVILGDGVIGLTTAWQLYRDGASVRIVGDGRPGASHAAAGMLSPSFEAQHDARWPGLGELLAEGLSAWDDFAGAVSSDPGGELGYRRDGIYGAGFGATVNEVPEHPDHRRFAVPFRSFAAGEGVVEPRRLLAKLRSVLPSSTLMTGIAALDRQNDAVTGLRLKDGTRLRAGTTIVAGGAASPAVPVRPVTGQAFLASWNERSPPSVVLRTPRAYFCPRMDGTLYIGATEEGDAPANGAAADLWSEAQRILPELAEAKLVEHFVGQRPQTADGRPRAERHERLANVIVATGHHRNGVLLAPLTARIVSSLTARPA